MANAVIAYTHNVCSSAMAMYAGRMAEVFQPIAEHFDPYRLPDYQLTPETASPWLAEAFEDLFCRRTSATWALPSISRFRGRPTLPSVEEKQHVSFKWRCTEPAWPGSNLIRDTFVRHDVTPLVMVRRSVAEQAIKIFLARKVYNKKHPQFVAIQLSHDEYRRYMDEQNSVSVMFNEEEKGEIGSLAQSVVGQTRNLIERVRYHFPAHQSPLLLIAEDVFRPLIDRQRHFHVMQRLLGNVTPLAPNVEIKLRKAGLDLRHCANAAEVFDSPQVKASESEYGEVLAKCDLIQFSPMAAP